MTRLSDLKLDMPTFHPLRDGLPNRAVFGTAGVRPDGWFQSVWKAISPPHAIDTMLSS